MTITKLIGRAKLRVHIEGCRQCGTLYAPSWREVDCVAIIVGKTTIRLAVHICGDCFKEYKNVCATAHHKKHLSALPRRGRPAHPRRSG